ncbi:HAMP domain-containing histidine kinase [Deinococcus sp. SDU3-2]|uniref:histidine kinase n=1 Tax=Deinococcus terrestris TaxID=2651870 RepID=A0A7X1NUV0_9DEIO|nr:HAMP domain-containing sensor histidine kinase [Deinococcus terrestris]MPY66225.1 HAMP domain-containing histidine kinase [Deinococcus terrestris]
MSTGDAQVARPGAFQASGRANLRRAVRGQAGTLRAQFTLVIFLLAFLPNLVLSVGAAGANPTSALALWLTLVAALCGGVGYLLSGVLLRPLRRLEGEVGAGSFAQPHADDPAEIRALRGAFTGLLERLSTEQERRGAFMATLVHDLRTPLIATGHLSRLLGQGALSAEQRREVAGEVERENARLLALVAQMADAHRFEREEVQLSPSPTDLGALLEEVARRLSPQADVRGLNLTATGTGHAPADAAVLERAVTNLAANALRYARTRVELRVTPQGLEVRDDGPGLCAPLSELAQPFNAQPATIAGQQYAAGMTGLGLFIARRVAEAHGGALEYRRDAASPLPTTFCLLLPEVTP